MKTNKEIPSHEDVMNSLRASSKNTDNSYLSLVPQEYQDTILKVADHTGMSINSIVQHLYAENGGNWDPKLKGIADPNDTGMSQLSKDAIKEITKPRGKNGNFFEQNYGHPFDIKDGHDQLLGYGVYMNYLKNFALPIDAKIKNPTERDVQLAYNLGATGLQRVYSGKANMDQLHRMDDYNSNLGMKSTLAPLAMEDHRQQAQ